MEHDNPALRDNLGDFTASRRLVLIAALAIPIGAISAVVAALLIQLIGTLERVLRPELLLLPALRPAPSRTLQQRQAQAIVSQERSE